MKAAVIYYSFEGNSTFVARQIAKQIKADIVQIEITDNKKRKGLAKYLWGGKQVIFKIIPEIKPVNFNAELYDLIIFGSPVWAGSPAPAIKTFLSQTKISGKKIALFLCHGGGAGKAMDKLKEMLTGNEFVSEIDFKYPIRNAESVIQKTEEWAKTL